MKTRPGKHLDQATDIILNDKEMEDLIKQLVQRAYDKGACITHLNKAISSVWQETFCIETKQEETKTLNEKETAFAKKVENFLSHYENDLSEFYYNTFSKKSWLTFRKEEFYKLLCSMYGTFEKEDTITKELMVKFAKKHGLNPYFHSFKDNISFLYAFISFHLYFSDNNTVPIYSEEYVSHDYQIVSMNDYNNFAKQYVLSSTKTCKTAVMAIWLIQKYF